MQQQGPLEPQQQGPLEPQQQGPLEPQQQGPLEPPSILATWKEVSKADIYNFLAICLHIGPVKKPQTSDYWSVNAGTHTSFAAQIMSR